MHGPASHGHGDDAAHASHEHGHDGHGGAGDGIDDLLELDARVLHDYWSAALDWVAAAVAGDPVRVLDLGAGTGTGAIGLAQRFRSAEVVAVDVSAGSLQRVAAKARELGLDGRLRTLEADLDEGLPDVGELGLTWASMSLHHLADPHAVLRELLAATRPGGVVAVAEFAQRLRFLPDDLGVGAPGFERRTIELLDRAHAEEMPTLGSLWAPRLADTGWTVVDERDFLVDLDRPGPDAARYAHAWFARVSDRLGADLQPEDRATLAALLDDDSPHSVLRRDDLHVRGTRTVTLGRRA